MAPSWEVPKSPSGDLNLGQRNGRMLSGDGREREVVEAFLGLAREIHEHHADNEAGVAIAMAGDDNAVTMDFLTSATDEVHGHFRPERKRPLRAELEAVFADADVVGGEGKLCSIFLNLYRLENPRGVEFARAHILDMSNVSYKG